MASRQYQWFGGGKTPAVVHQLRLRTEDQQRRISGESDITVLVYAKRPDTIQPLEDACPVDRRLKTAYRPFTRRADFRWPRARPR